MAKSRPSRRDTLSAPQSPDIRSQRHRFELFFLALLAVVVLATLVWVGSVLVNLNDPARRPPVVVAVLPTDAPTSTPTITPSVTPTPDVTETPTRTDTPMPSLTATALPADTATPTEDLSPAPSLSSTETTLPTDTAVPEQVSTAATEPSEQPIASRPCISMVGDSVTHGGVTYEIPATGYIVGQTTPLAVYVQQALLDQGITDLQVRDRGTSNTGISSTNHPSYFKTAAYESLLADHCKYTMIMPWINDISPGIPLSEAAPRHVRALIALAKELAAENPDGRIVILNYFYGAVAPFAQETWAVGLTPEDVDGYNREIELSCDYGSLSTMPQVACADVREAFAGMGTSYVIGTISHQELNTTLIAPLNEIYVAWLDQYYAVHPDGLLQGDGVHLSVAGKKALATYLVTLR